MLTKRLGKKGELTPEDQSLYYSSWQFAAIHMAATIPQFQTIAALSSELRIPISRVAAITEKLAAMSLVEKRSDHVRATNSQNSYWQRLAQYHQAPHKLAAASDRFARTRISHRSALLSSCYNGENRRPKTQEPNSRVYRRIRRRNSRI